MKYLPVTLALSGVLLAQNLSLTHLLKTNKYTHTLLAKSQYKRLLKTIATVKKDKAYEIAKANCENEIEHAELKKHGNRLFYCIITSSCKLKVDALDGSIMNKKKLEQ